MRLLETGLHIMPEQPYLGASFDRIVEIIDTKTERVVSRGIVELKCPQALPSEMNTVVVLQTIMQMAVAASWDVRGEDDTHVWLDVFYYCGKSSKVVPREWLPAEQFIWEKQLLPQLYNFFFSQLAPALLQPPSSWRQQVQQLNGIAADALVSPRRPAPAAAATIMSPVHTAATPGLKPGKLVTSKGKPGAIGILQSMQNKDEGSSCWVAWPNDKRMRVCAAESLSVYPLAPDEEQVPPTRAGQPIVVLRGEYANAHGTIIQRTGAKWSVQLNGGKVVALDPTVLHAKAAAGDPNAPQVSVA